MKKNKKSMKLTGENLIEAENNIGENIENAVEIKSAIENTTIEATLENASENFDTAENGEAESVVENSAVENENTESEGSDGMNENSVENTSENEEIAETVATESVENDGLKNTENENTEVENAAADVSDGIADTEVSGNDGTDNKDGSKKVDTVEPKKERRTGGSGSVYPIKSGGYGWCVQLSVIATKEQKARFGNKLRVLGTSKTYEGACEGAENATEHRVGLLQEKLVKLGWFDNANAVEPVDNANVNGTTEDNQDSVG